MTFLRSIVNDLREKRLWPVVAALTVALVAVPLVLSSSSGSVQVPQLPPTAPAASPAAAVPAVSVIAAPTNSRLTGPGRDPFTPRKLPPAKATTVSPASTASTAGTPGSNPPAHTAGGSSPSAGTPAGSGSPAQQEPPLRPKTPARPKIPTAPSRPQTTYFVYSVDLAFGRLGQHARTYRNVARLTPFPSAKNPILVFLGIKSDGRTAVFLASSRLWASGRGSCLPSSGKCEFLDLKAGQQERLLVVNAHGGLDEYTLRLSAVRMTPISSGAHSPPARARPSPAGQFDEGLSAASLSNGAVVEPLANGQR